MTSKTFDKISEDYCSSIALINSLDDWLFLRHIPENCGRLLDIGCGSGNLLNTLAPHSKEAFGIDISKKMISSAKKLNPNLALTHGDANKLPYPDNFFDYIVSHTTFHHLNRTVATNEARRTLKQGGTLIIMDVSKEPRGFIRPIHTVFLRRIISRIRLNSMYGGRLARQAWKYKKHPEWKEHRRKEKHRDFTRDQTKEFYTKLLPECKIYPANSSIDAVIWKKRSS